MGKDGQLQLCITLTLFQATLFTQKKIEEIEENFQIQKNTSNTCLRRTEINQFFGWPKC